MNTCDNVTNTNHTTNNVSPDGDIRFVKYSASALEQKQNKMHTYKYQ